MVVNRCDVAERMDSYHNLKTYATYDCASKEIIETEIENVKFRYLTT